MPQEDHLKDKCQDHAAVNQQVAKIMQGIGRNRYRACFADDIALIGDKAEGQQDGDHHDDNPHCLRLNRFRVEQALSRLEQEEDCGSGDDGGLEEPGQRLRLAMAETVIPVRRDKGLTYGEEVDAGGHEIEQGIDQRREHGDRIGCEIGE